MRGSTSAALYAGSIAWMPSSFVVALGESSVATFSSQPPENKTAPIVQRTTGSWYHLLVQRRPYPGHPGIVDPIALCALYRAHPHELRMTFAPTFLVRLSAVGRTSLLRRKRRYSFRS